EAVALAEGDAGALEALRPPRERVRAEAEAAGGFNRLADVRPRHARVDLLVDAEREEVVAVGGRDLFADEDEHVVVPALLAAALGLERVVVGEQHYVDAG